MRKRIFGLGLILLLLLAFIPANSAFAAEEEAQLAYVTDVTGSLSDYEKESLNRTAEEISLRHQCGVYIVVLEDYYEYGNRDIESCAEGIYQFYQLGFGEEKDGVMLIMSMAQREYDLAAYGAFGNYAFTDYGKDYLSRSFLDNFRRDDWYGGFQDYLESTDQMLVSARAGEPVDIVIDREETPVNPMFKLLTALLPSSLVAFLVCGQEKRKMKTAVSRRTAEEYVVPGSARLYLRQDRFLHRSRSVQVIQNKPQQSAGGGTTINSGGFSHHSGKF